VGQLLETLKQTGQLDNTVIAFTADHGDMVGGHGMAWKSTTSMYDEVLNIPFLLSYPKLFKPDVSEISVDHVDWMPTLLELAGQAQSVPSNHAGRSLVPYLTGDKDPGKAYPYKLSERVKTHPEGLRKITPETDAIFVLRGNGWKYRFQHGKPEYLYHLQNDPGEIHNLANNADFAQIKADLRSELVDYLKRTDWKGRNVD
jgi:arylsulfatase A-like enzyme